MIWHYSGAELKPAPQLKHWVVLPNLNHPLDGYSGTFDNIYG